MQTVMRTTVRLPLRYILLIGLLFLLAVSLYLYFGIDDPKLSALVGGISGGVAVYIIVFLFSIYEYRQIDRFRALGVVEVLPDRRDDDYYRNIVKDAKTMVQVMGTSCTRFVDDFANIANDEHVLVDALNRNAELKVQFLVPEEKYMDESSQHRFAAGRLTIEKLKDKYKRRIEMRRFDFQARHSMVRVDNDLIVGPVFKEVESRNTPAIHVDIKSAFAEKYVEYFSWVWGRSQPFE